MPTSPYYIERALRITGHTEGFNHYYQLVRNLRITGNTGSSIYLVRQLSVNGQSIPAPSVPAYLNRALRIAGNTDFFSILLTRQLNITGSLPAPSAELDIISALDEVRIGIRMADFGHRREPLSTPTTPPNLQAVTGATGFH
jgi:hypothetical protein